MKAGDFWTPGVTAFFDVRVTYVTSLFNQGEHTATIFKQQENEKKPPYLNTPSVLTTYHYKEDAQLGQNWS